MAGFLEKPRRKQFFFEQRHAQNLQQIGHAALDVQFLAHDRYQHVHAHCDLHLRLDRVGRVAVEHLEAQVLLDPLEEQLHVPTPVIQLGYRQRRQVEVVGQEHELSAQFLLPVPDPSQRLGIQAGRLGSAQTNGRVAAQAGAPPIFYSAIPELSPEQ